MRGLLLALAAALVLALPGLAGAATAKYTFDPVTYPDGTSGVVEASVKRTTKTTAVVCTYYSQGYAAYLGRYQEYDGFFSTDPDEVRAFCLDHYGERTP